MSGWIKLHRSLIEWEWYSDPKTFRVFIHCLLKANHKDKKHKGTLIKRGCFVTGLSLISSETGLSIQSIRTCFSKLKSTNELTIKTTSKGTHIQVVNYCKYQTLTSEVTNEQQTNNKQTTTNKNDKKVNNEKNKESFDIFWNAYPKKVNKSKCLDKFIKLPDSDIEKILSTIGKFVSHKPFKEYTHPHPMTYLNQERWNDVIDEFKETKLIGKYGHKI